MEKIIVCFVKTPGHSDLKTRLSKTIGRENAETFFLLSVAVIRSLFERLKTKGYTPIWAVAEKDALNHSLWSGFETLWQGDGGLGNRLSFVEEKLYPRFSSLMYIGGDAPQISLDMITDCQEKLAGHADYCIGPSEDGGFWLYGGKIPAGRKVWENVIYSSDQTLSDTVLMLQRQGRVELLQTLRDVDHFEDLKALATFMEGRQSDSKLSQPETELLSWCWDINKAFSS